MRGSVLDAYLLGALTSATRFSNACWRGVAVDIEEFCKTAAIRIQVCRQTGSGRAYHPAETLAKLSEDGIPKRRVDVEATKFERGAPVGHKPS